MTARPYAPTRYAAGVRYDERAIMPVISELKFSVIVYGATASDLMMIGGADCIMSRPVHKAAERLGLKWGDYSPYMVGVRDLRLPNQET